MRKDMVFVRDLWDCGFDINCFVKIYDGAGSDSWYEKKPIFSGFGSEDRPPEEVLGMRVSYITTDNHQIVIEAEKLAEDDSRRARLKAALQDLYDAASVVNQITDDNDYERYPDLLDEAANIMNEMESLEIVSDGIVEI